MCIHTQIQICDPNLFNLQINEPASCNQLAMKMDTKTLTNTYKSFRFRVTLHIDRLRISREAEFSCKVQWKRHQSKAQTKIVQHKNNESVFNEDLVLEFNIQQDIKSKLYHEKNVRHFVTQTDIFPVIITENGLKSGGFVRFDLAEPLNHCLMSMTQLNKETDKQIQLSKCPDPNGSIKFTLLYQNLGQSSSSIDESVNDSNLEIPQTPKNSAMDKGTTVSAISFSSVPEAKEFNELVQRHSQAKLKKIIESLEKRLQDSKNRQEALKSENEKLKQGMLTLQKTLDKRTAEVLEKGKELAVAKAHNDFCPKSCKKADPKEEEITKLNAKLADYQKKISMKSQPGVSPQKQNSVELRKSQAQQDGSSTASQSSDEALKELEAQKQSLQQQLSISNFRIAHIFNVAFQLGGPQLLDMIQSCIAIE